MHSAAPATPVVTLEHPCVVADVDAAVRSLGGPVVLDKFLQTRDRHKTIGASLRPPDAMAKPVMSGFVKTQNLLLKLTLPARTGRKRKRGSDGPWEPAAPGAAAAHTDARVLLQSLRDNPGRCTIRPLGQARETHRFRNLPDFQYATSASPLAHMLRETFLPLQYSDMRNFKLSDERGIQPGNDVGPSAQFSTVDVPYNYSYRQNPAIKVATDAAGHEIMYNPTASRRFVMHQVAIDDKHVLHASPVALPPEDSLDPHIRSTISSVRRLLEERPIMTKRYLMNNVDAPTDDSIRSSYAYVGYSFKSGPWRDTLIKFGVDPRTDPKYRVYQTLMFKIVLPSEKESHEDPNRWMDARSVWRKEGRPRSQKKTTHLFDGKTLTPDGKVWQVCDIIDPQLRQILDTDKLRTECNIKSDGWYLNGTWAKVKVLMREKINVVMKGAVPNESDYRRIMEFPDLITPENLDETTVGRDASVSEKEYKMLADVRNLAKLKYSMWGKDKGIGDEDVELADASEPSQSPPNSPDRGPDAQDAPNRPSEEGEVQASAAQEGGTTGDEATEEDLGEESGTLASDASEDEDSENEEEGGVDDLMGPALDDTESDGDADGAGEED